MTTLIFSVAIAMLISFLCSLMEAALLSLNPGKLALLAKRHPKTGKMCVDFKKNIEKPIAVILILNTTAHTFGAAIAGAQFDKLYGSDYIWLFSLAFTILMVQYTEILPKTVGVRFNTFVISCTASTLNVAIKLMTPFIALVHFVNRPFEGRRDSESVTSQIAIDELNALASMAREEGHISKTQEHVIHKIPDLQDDMVTELMIPVEKMISFSADMNHETLLEIVRQNPHERYPVRASKNSSDFLGVVAVRHLLFCEKNNWQAFIRPIVSISSDQKQLLIAENISTLDSKLLLVKDQKGNTLGMLTIHDLIMKLFSRSSLKEKAA